MTGSFPHVSRRTAQRNLVRGMRFLSTLSRVPEIRAALDEGAGYTEEDHAEGWSVLLAALGYARPGLSAGGAGPSPQQAALVALDEWDGANFDRARASLRYAFPEQYSYVFEGLTAATGVGTIGSVKTFVDRVAALRDGTDPTREGTREVDAAAAERLARRKIFSAEIQAHLESLLGQTQELAPLPPQPAASETQQQAADDALHAWLSDWAGQARSFITRGDYLIRLGLASRKNRDDEGGEAEEEEEAVLVTEPAAQTEQS